MEKDNIFSNKEALDKLISGISKSTAIIKGTYGAAGGNVILEESLYPYHTVRNDGKAIVDKIKLADPIENIGANIIREVGDKADHDSGDGRKTTMILVEAILKEAQTVQGLPLEIKKSLNDCIPVINKSIDDQKKEITVDDIKSVATISSESEEIGQLIQEIYKEIGKDGIIEVDNSNLPETFYEITEGVRLRGTKASGYSSTEEGKAVYINPKILITRDKITSVDQLEPILTGLNSIGVSQLVIYCDEIDVSVLSRLAYTHIQGGFKTLIIKSPTLWKDWLFQDFAKITGATIVDSNMGKTFKSLTVKDLGTCQRIVASIDETRIIGIKDISEYIEQLKENGKVDDQQLLRASWLQTKAAVLKVGANSESELSYISKKAKDATHASYLALKDGVVAGGGIALLNASKMLPDTLGAKILKEALIAPFSQLIDNAGTFDLTKGEMKMKPLDNIGLDVKNNKVVDMFEVGIIDPALVIKNCVKNAISIASTVLTANGIIVLPKQNHENSPKMPGLPQT